MARKMKNHGKWKTHCRKLNMTKNIKKFEKWEMQTVGPGIWWENWKSLKIRKTHCWTGNMARKTEKRENMKCTLWEREYGEKTENHGKWETNTVGCEIWQETLKKLGNEYLIMARKLKNVENKTQTIFNLEYGDKHWESWKMWNAHGRNCNMARKVIIVENEKDTL